MSSSIPSRPSDVVSALLVDASENDRATIGQHVSAYPTPLLERLVAAGCCVRPLAKGERYRDTSAALRRLGVDVDAWPVPPAGLFVVEERTVYLRSRSAMTTGHEVAHAIDCALGDGIYRSGLRYADSLGVRGDAVVRDALRRDRPRRVFRGVRPLVRRRAQRSTFAVAARDARASASLRSDDARDRRGDFRFGELGRNAGGVGVAQ